MLKRAVIGDVHGCIDEFVEMVNRLSHHTLDEIWVLGDLVDRGPDSGAVVEYARLHGIRAVKGNHESTIVDYRSKDRKDSNVRNQTMSEIRSEADWQYMADLPMMHVDDEQQTIFVHGGLWPHIPLYKQPTGVMFAQLINPYKPGDTQWWGTPQEQEFLDAGYKRWYEVCDEPYKVFYGHSVFPEVFIHNNTVGMDTGCVFGGKLSACIVDSMEILSVKPKKTYWVTTGPKGWS